MADDSKTDKNHADLRQDNAEAPNAKVPDRENPENKQDKLSERLDEGLEETFPSSDPVSVKITK